MLTNILMFTFRNFKKNKVYFLINIFGLAIGMSLCLLIWHYVHYEKSYDIFHKNSDRIFRLRYERYAEDGTSVRFASCAPPAGQRIRDRFSEAEKVGRLLRYKAAVSFQNNKFIEDRMYFAESQFLDILKFKFISGDPLKGIEDPNKAFISQSIARKYFGEADPIGKTISVDKKIDYIITGVFEDIPENSHIKFDILLSFKNIEDIYGADILEAWGHSGFFTYLMLRPGTDIEVFKHKIANLVEEEFGEALKYYGLTCELPLQPLTDIHLTSHYAQEYEVNGDYDRVNFLFYIAFFVIIIAWINYINLSTSQAFNRIKEVGIRKVNGATRRQLIFQFFTETFVLYTIASFVVIILISLSLPVLQDITGTPLDYSIWQQNWFWFAFSAMFLFGVLISGYWPVMVLTSFNPVSSIKGPLVNSGRGFNARKALVVFQFILAAVLITGTYALYQQILFMKHQNLGVNIEQILVFKSPRIRNKTFDEQFKSFKEAIIQSSDIEVICHATEVPGRQIYWDAGGIYRTGADQNDSKNYQIVGIDHDFVDVFGLNIIQGRNFSRQFASDDSALILNETAVDWMGFESPQDAIGKQVSYWGEIYNIVGVIKDFHQQSLKEPYEPHIYRLLPHGRGVRGYFAVKVKTANMSDLIENINETYAQFFPENPFEYFFLDEYYNEQYKSDELFYSVFGIFSCLAIVIASSGILGLSLLMVARRTKEIGIRKVLGASITKIIVLLTGEFVTLIVLAYIITIPISYFGINMWLENYANRMGLHAGLFLMPFFMVLIITFITIGSHITKASLSNPVDSIRYE